MSATPLTLSGIDNLPAALTTEQAAQLLGCSPDLLWKAAREHTAPLEPLRIGARSLRWPTAKVLALLGLEPAAET